MGAEINGYLDGMKSIAVFCGSSSGNDPRFLQAAHDLGKCLADRNIELVYGGAQVGLMGAVANGALKAGGKVTGVIPEFLTMKEIVHPNLTELIRVETMHERKQIEYDRCDGSISLPGGFGTLDEMFEMLTWGQLGLHTKPVGLLNIDGYFNDLLKLIDRMVEDGFLKDMNRDMLLVQENMEELLEKMEGYQAPGEAKWIKIEQAMKGPENNENI